MSAIRTAPMWLALGVTIAAAPVAAHDLWPAYLEIREETGVDQYSAYWKVPARDGRPLALELMWPSNCVFETPIDRLVARAWVSQWQLSCPGGLQGRSLGVHGLDRAATDVLVRIVAATGRFSTHRLTPDNAEFSVPEMRDPPSNLASWVALGIEHIIAGPDHLAFVLALLLLVRNFRRLITTVTAFTLAHSLTLSAAALGTRVLVVGGYPARPPRSAGSVSRSTPSRQ